MAYRLFLSEQTELRQAAMDIHECVVKYLVSCHLVLQKLQTQESSPSIPALDEIHTLTQQATSNLRMVLQRMSPSLLYELGLEGGIKELIAMMNREHNVRITFEEEGAPLSLDISTRLVLYEAVHELLENVLKHSMAVTVDVRLERHARFVKLIVEDDGVGFRCIDASSNEVPREGLGLFGVEQLIKHLGGHLNIFSAYGLGSRVTLVAPVSDSVTSSANPFTGKLGI